MPATDVVLVPVPLHWQRHRQRGFNQSEILAKELGKLLNLPVETNGINRLREPNLNTSCTKTNVAKMSEMHFRAKQNYWATKRLY